MIETWGTWDGRVIQFERLTWQHLSNIHYFMNITFRDAYDKHTRAMVRSVLFKKHGGILPYHPDRHFDYEKIQLVRFGYLKNNGDIVVDGHKIGWYEEPLV
ncbi:MAG: hypothetical protein ACTSRU_21210 [Candidatus Hodarchaeales archaeon]